MADTPPDRREPSDDEETAKLELPSLRLPRLRRRRREPESVDRPDLPDGPPPPDRALDESEEIQPGLDLPEADQPEPEEAGTALPDLSQHEEAPLPVDEPAAPAAPSAPGPPPPFEAELADPYVPEVSRPVGDSDGMALGPAASPVPGLDRAPVDLADHLDAETDAEREGEPARERRPLTVPALPSRAAAVVTGVVVGLFGVLATYASLKGCDVVRGADTCGGPGLLILVVILVLMVLLGGLLLAAWKVPEAGSTSFLAVGLLCVVVLLTLIEQIYSPWMFLVVPVLSAASYALAHWVTTTFIEPAPEKGPEHDVR